MAQDFCLYSGKTFVWICICVLQNFCMDMYMCIAKLLYRYLIYIFNVKLLFDRMQACVRLLYL